MAKMDDIKSYKYMSIEEEADFTKRVLDLLENTNYKEIQIYEKNRPGFDSWDMPRPVAIMGQEEVKEIEKT
jgi:hypothetical protein